MSRQARLVMALLGGLWLAGGLAHEGHPPPVVAAASAPLAEELGSAGTRDAQRYFTDTLLRDQHGRELRFYSDVLAGRVVLLNVVFTRCEDACPLITRKLVEVRQALGKDAAQVHFISLSSDPANDTPAQLAAFARQHGADDPNWLFLSGEPARVAQVLARLGQLSRSPEEHSTLLIAGDVANKRWSKIRPDAPPAAIAQRLQLLTQPPVGR